MAATAKPDTVLLVFPGTSWTADQSQEATNLTSATGGAYETSSSRATISMAAREVSVTFDADTGSSGYLVYQGDTAATDVGYTMSIASSQVTFVASGPLEMLPATTLPGISGSLQSFTVQACTRPNPLTTGASNAYLTETWIRNNDTGAITQVQTEHAVYAPNASENLSIGGIYTGTGTLTAAYSDGIDEVRLGRRFHSTAEAYEDFATGETSSGSGAELVDPELLAIEADGQDAEFGGPVYLGAGFQCEAGGQRLAYPLVNFYNPRARPVGGWWGVIDEVSEVMAVAPSASQVAGFADGKGGANDRARDFDDTTDTYFVATDAALGAQLANGTTTYTISAWVYFDHFTGNVKYIYFNGDSGTQFSALLQVSTSGFPQFFWYQAGTKGITGGTALTVSTWHHVSVTVVPSGANQVAYLELDGTLVGTSSSLPSPTSASSTHYIGGSGIALRAVDGRIAEVKIEPADESGATVAGSYNTQFEAGLDESVLNPYQPLAWWRLHQPTDGYAPARNFVDVDVGGDTYRADASYYWNRPAHPMFTHAKVRVFATVIFVGTGTHDAVEVAVVSATKRPTDFVLQGSPVDVNAVTATISAAASGDEYELTFASDLPIARDGDGFTHIYVATRMGGGSPTGDTYIKITNVHLTCYPKTQGGTLPLAPGS